MVELGQFLLHFLDSLQIQYIHPGVLLLQKIEFSRVEPILPSQVGHFDTQLLLGYYGKDLEGFPKNSYALNY